MLNRSNYLAHTYKGKWVIEPYDSWEITNRLRDNSYVEVICTDGDGRFMRWAIYPNRVLDFEYITQADLPDHVRMMLLTGVEDEQLTE